MIVDWILALVHAHEALSLVIFSALMVAWCGLDERHDNVQKRRKKLRAKFTRPVISINGENEVDGKAQRWQR